VTLTDAITQDVKTAEILSEQEIRTFRFDIRQSTLLHHFAEEVAAIGGPQASGAESKASMAATELMLSFSKGQCELLGAYSNGLVSMLIFEGLQKINDVSPPNALPDLNSLENRHDVLCLSSRSQILLKLVDNRAFAYDLDNEGRLVRLVANFKGGGLIKINAEPETNELSSHSGRALGPHTEAPYWCAVNAKDGHSPSPSSLILTALWNPSLEPARVIPLPPILDQIGFSNCLALTTGNFQFTRSDSFVSGKGKDGRNVSILEFDDNVGFAARFNSYRFSVNDNVSTFIRRAYSALCQSVDEAIPVEHTLTQESAIAINNIRALHCRDVMKDNRRVLVRIFGLSKFSSPIVISDDPLLIQG
jgi:hypothetical protein